MLPPCGHWGTAPSAQRRGCEKWSVDAGPLSDQVGDTDSYRCLGRFPPPSWSSPGCVYSVCPIYPRKERVCALYLAVTSGLQVNTKVWEGHPEVHVPLVVVPRLCVCYVQLLAADPKTRVRLLEGGLPFPRWTHGHTESKNGL